MSTVLAQADRLLLPSEALGRDFEMVGVPLPGQAPAGDAEHVDAHAVLIGNIGLLLPRDQISELVENASVCRLPNTSTWFNGITSVRGNMIPVFDLHELFDIALADTRRRLIVIGENDTAIALWVDDFPHLITLDSDDEMTSEPPIPSLIRDHAHKYFLKDGQIWVDWNVASFVTTLGEML